MLTNDGKGERGRGSEPKDDDCWRRGDGGDGNDNGNDQKFTWVCKEDDGGDDETKDFHASKFW